MSQKVSELVSQKVSELVSEKVSELVSQSITTHFTCASGINSLTLAGSQSDSYRKREWCI